MRVVIIEDEKLSAEHLVMLLKKIDPSIEIMAYADTIKATVDLFKERIPCDLLFMDIHLADGNSFEIFKQVPIDAPVIFTTAYDNYAIQAFKQNSIDYLLKPLSLPDLQFALDKFGKKQEAVSSLQMEAFLKTYQQLASQFKTRFIVKLGDSIDTVPSSEIRYFETKDSLSYLFTNTGRKYIIEYTLEQLEQLLDPKDFFRINRKVILHIQAIEKIKSHLNSRLVVSAGKLEGDSQIVSRERVADFKRWLGG